MGNLFWGLLSFSFTLSFSFYAPFLPWYRLSTASFVKIESPGKGHNFGHKCYCKIIICFWLQDALYAIRVPILPVEGENLNSGLNLLKHLITGDEFRFFLNILEGLEDYCGYWETIKKIELSGDENVGLLCGYNVSEPVSLGGGHIYVDSPGLREKTTVGICGWVLRNLCGRLAVGQHSRRIKIPFTQNVYGILWIIFFSPFIG